VHAAAVGGGRADLLRLVWLALVWPALVWLALVWPALVWLALRWLCGGAGVGVDDGLPSGGAGARNARP